MRVVLTVVAFFALLLLLSEVVIRVEAPSTASMFLYYTDGGEMRLAWSGVPRASGYEVEALRETDGARRQTLFFRNCATPECFLPASLMEEDELELRVTPHRELSLFGMRMNWKGRRPLTAIFSPAKPRLENVRAVFRSEEKQVHLSWEGTEGDAFRVELTRDRVHAEHLQDVSAFETNILFGDEQGLPLPERGETYTLTLQPMRMTGKLTQYGETQIAAAMVRDDLLDKNVVVESETEGQNRFVLRWNETAGEGYEV